MKGLKKWLAILAVAVLALGLTLPAGAADELTLCLLYTSDAADEL